MPPSGNFFWRIVQSCSSWALFYGVRSVLFFYLQLLLFFFSTLCRYIAKSGLVTVLLVFPEGERICFVLYCKMLSKNSLHVCLCLWVFMFARVSVGTLSRSESRSNEIGTRNYIWAKMGFLLDLCKLTGLRHKPTSPLWLCACFRKSANWIRMIRQDYIKFLNQCIKNI